MRAVNLILAICMSAGSAGVDSLAARRPPDSTFLPCPVKRTHEGDQWIAVDKLWHFSASFVTVGASYHLCTDRLGMGNQASVINALGGTAALGVAKELSDVVGPNGHFSWRDLVADAAGIALGYFVFIHRY